MADNSDNHPSDRVILKGEAALVLWRQRKEVWNQWVEDNPVADIDFSGVDRQTLTLLVSKVHYIQYEQYVCLKELQPYLMKNMQGQTLSSLTLLLWLQ